MRRALPCVLQLPPLHLPMEWVTRAIDLASLSGLYAKNRRSRLARRRWSELPQETGEIRCFGRWQEKAGRAPSKAGLIPFSEGRKGV